MPQGWHKNWPLPDGSAGIDYLDFSDPTEEDEVRAQATRKRDVAIQTIGNLTLLSTALNSAQSNLQWDQKRPEMARHSLLPINQRLLQTLVWDEDAILSRGKERFERALMIWPR